MRFRGLGRTALLAGLLAMGCQETSTQVGLTSLLFVSPTAEATLVSVLDVIEVGFDAPVAAGVMHPIALQVGDCPGPVVPGTWTRSPDGMALRFSPTVPLSPGTRYSIHVGGGITDTQGAVVDLERHGLAEGGSWVTQAMVMGMPSTGMGMGMGSTLHSGPEWRYPNGQYGLSFSFTTAPTAATR